jgi:cytoskeletal protein RodZ
MQINTNKSSNRKMKMIVVAALAVVVLGAGAVYAYSKISSQGSTAKSDPNKVDSVNYDKATKEQQDAGAAAKKEAIEREESKNNPTPPSSTAPPVTITSSNQDSGVLAIRTMIDTATSGGTCQLQMSKTGSTTITQEVDTQSLGSYMVCKGFDIPTANLEKGDWKISVTYKKDNTSSSVEKVVTVS